MTDERTIQADDVRREQEAKVKQPLQWAYLVTVLIGGAILMLVLISILGSNAG